MILELKMIILFSYVFLMTLVIIVNIVAVKCLENDTINVTRYQNDSNINNATEIAMATNNYEKVTSESIVKTFSSNNKKFYSSYKEKEINDYLIIDDIYDIYDDRIDQDIEFIFAQKSTENSYLRRRISDIKPQGIKEEMNNLFRAYIGSPVRWLKDRSYIFCIGIYIGI